MLVNPYPYDSANYDCLCYEVRESFRNNNVLMMQETKEHKRIRYHIFIQNIKALDIGITLLIHLTFIPYMVDMRPITLTSTRQYL